MSGSCNGCGRCCDPVVLPFTPNEIRTYAHRFNPPEDAIFILEHMTPIQPRRRGIELTRDYLSQGGKTVFGLGLDDQIILFSWFYECDMYDRETRTCTAYDDRPTFCRGYPWGDEPPDPAKAIPLECGYNVDVGRPVALIRKEDRARPDH